MTGQAALLAQGHQLGQRRLVDKAGDAEVAVVHPQQEGGVGEGMASAKSPT